ncbi:bifunctional proline dehydrogenase/L-glutamate gamma-semialdehyde dehydrogenase PutA [Marinobacterium rhizophilum]|uniref:bifunctional proline dehydrogenase/L-glutamate gamma-semialdehyde dehydrogenase PutA n=1 Tax=Marinobacterium rhizophilum TaxID=420402 RepID=UPI000372157F|nr:bifunctional proline dehydrogenase/L-glutamate gamma-semialdehyde dehydrogenase PutA [Marinobacterium rhizophilum]
MFKAIDVLNPDFITRTPADLWTEISPLYSVDEATWLQQLLPLAKPAQKELEETTLGATRLIEQVRADDAAIHMIDALLLEYSLDTREGILLMCLAEALMRIPDADTADALIRDKLSVADWKKHLKNSDSLFVNASTWGLLLTGKVVTMDEKDDGTPANVINRLVNRFSEPVIRKAMYQAMKIMGHQFVLGRNIGEALKRGRKYRDLGYTYSFDMLGEAALTERDADKYFADYLRAVESVGGDTYDDGKASRPTISIKLSALHPRYEAGQHDRVMTELYARVLQLISKARTLNVGITIDAEEADRLELSLELFEKLYRDPACTGWGNFGLVVQAYSKRALAVLAWLASLAGAQGDRIPVRLVKGAYWDAEIKLCQQRGLNGYPVYTRKEATDTAYLACARFLLSDPVRGKIFPQFASHNAHTVASVLTMAQHNDFEFQRLHGMGDALYNRVLKNHPVSVRIYAPVGSHKDLLPYLVRRLLENGANSSFVHRLVDARHPIADLVHHPVETLTSRASLANPHIPLPRDLYGDERRNSFSPNIEIDSQWAPFKQAVDGFMQQQWHGGPIINARQHLSENVHPVLAPQNHAVRVGEMHWASAQHVSEALDLLSDGFVSWNATPVDERAACLERLADLLEAHLAELVALCHLEAGKTIQDSIDEVREAVDFCRYYAVQARNGLGQPLLGTAFNGKERQYRLDGRGVFVCISPWNFPLAIFLGQVSAALVAGNSVIAKPAEQTSLIACRAVELALQAGIPADAIALLPGDGASVGAPLTRDPRIAGVAFTGSTETAQLINRSLAQRDAEIVPLIAETGGQNAMIIDSTSLPEQVVRDVVHSAFASAGQRCSALRVLYVQEDVADRIIDMLRGAMAQQVLGDPSLHSTDIGPVIDRKAQQGLQAHIEKLKASAQLIGQTPLPENAAKGTFVAPTAFEISDIAVLEREQFGPILHVVRYKAAELDKVIDAINATGYGLTLGVHSRNEETTRHIARRVRVGNIYINRDQIGAVVGVQPFGGQGLSGTGPKAGGPRYLPRFTREVAL